MSRDQSRAEKRRLTIEVHAKLTDELGTGRPPTAVQLAEALGISYNAALQRAIAYNIPVSKTGPATRPGCNKWASGKKPSTARLKVCQARSRRLIDEGDLPLSTKYLRKLDAKIDEWRSRVPPGLI